MPLKNKSIFITGGTGGIGKPLVKLLQQAECRVELFQAARHGDLIKDINQVCDYLSTNTPDILINMAAINVLDYCENQDIDQIMALNLIVPMKLTQAVLKTMKKRQSGHIVNIGSMMALIPLPHYTGYVAAKAGLKGFNDALRRELHGKNISITHVLPRATRTKMNDGVQDIVNRLTSTRYDSAERVAEKVLNAIKKRKKEVKIGMPERLIANINAFAPGFIDLCLVKNKNISESVLKKSRSGNN